MQMPDFAAKARRQFTATTESAARPLAKVSCCEIALERRSLVTHVPLVRVSEILVQRERRAKEARIDEERRQKAAERREEAKRQKEARRREERRQREEAQRREEARRNAVMEHE